MNISDIATTFYCTYNNSYILLYLYIYNTNNYVQSIIYVKHRLTVYHTTITNTNNNY